MTCAHPPEHAGALRLHLNENAGGCSAMVIDAIRKMSAEDIACYPDYSALSRECADYLGVREAQLLLTNGLDEGLLALTVNAFSAARIADAPHEAIVPEPAFEMYSVFVKAAGGRVVTIPPKAGFAFPAQDIRDAVTGSTRMVFFANPNNPTGQLIPRDAIRELARDVPSAVTIVLDEAYYDFCGETFLPELDAHANVFIGRTFAKAHGLAGLRAGCVIGSPERLEAVRRVVPPFSVSVVAEAGWRASLRDRDHVEWYRAQVEESREMIYAACDRLDLPYWRSAGNFVLIHVERAGRPAEIVRAFADRGILVRDRSRDPGCGGCIRITAGLVRHTEAAVHVLEGLCAVP